MADQGEKAPLCRPEKRSNRARSLCLHYVSHAATLVRTRADNTRLAAAAGADAVQQPAAAATPSGKAVIMAQFKL